MTDEKPGSIRSSWMVAVVALIAAMVPHFFFATPLKLHMHGEFQLWVAISVWAPAMLAAGGFFDAGSFSDSLDPGPLEAFKLPILVGAPFAFLALVAFQYGTLWTDLPRRPWDELRYALPLYALLWALLSVYWQGLVQHRLLRDSSAPVRVGLVVAGNVVVGLPFLLNVGMSELLAGYISPVALAAFLAALAFEAGAKVRSVMLLNAFFGMMFIWFQQALLL